MLLRTVTLFLLIGSSTFLNAQNLDFEEGLKWKEKGNLVEAIKHFDKAFQTDPGNTEILTEYGNSAFAARKYALAIPALESLVKIEPKNISALAKLAKIYSCSSHKNKSIAFAERAIKLKPTKHDDQVALGDALFFVKHYPKAIKMYQKIQPANTYAVNKIAKSYSRMGNYNSASKHFYTLINMQENPKPELYYQYGNALFDAGRHKLATRAYIEAKEKGFYNPRLINESIAVGFLALKAYEPAMEYYLEAKKSAPYDKPLNLDIAKCYNLMGQYSKAREVIDEMLESNPDDGDLVYSYGMTYFKEGKIAKAEKYFNKAFEMKPILKSLRVVKSSF